MLRKTLSNSGAAVVISLVAGCQNAPPQPTQNMSATEVKASLTSVTYYAYSPMAATSGIAPLFNTYVRPDGTAVYRDKVRTDQGVYFVRADGAMCFTWKIINGATETCRTVTRDGDKFAFSTNGVISSVFTVKPGNPEGL